MSPAQQVYAAEEVTEASEAVEVAEGREGAEEGVSMPEEESAEESQDESELAVLGKGESEENIESTEDEVGDVAGDTSESESVIEEQADEETAQEVEGEDETETAEEIDEEDENQEAEPVSLEVTDPTNDLAPIAVIGGGYTVTATVDDLDASLEKVTVNNGQAAEIEVTLTNIAGQENFVLYLFLSKADDLTNFEDEGIFTTDHYYIDQSVPVGESKTYTFTWLNDEEVGDYRLIAEIKQPDWLGDPLQKQQVGFVNIPESLTTQSTNTQLHRFWSDAYNGHFYTTDEIELFDLKYNNPNWRYEGISAKALSLGKQVSDEAKTSLTVTPVYRFWSEQYKHHFYTILEEERDDIRQENPNWKYEGEVYDAFASQQMDTTEVYRFWSDAYQAHFYTSSKAEKESIQENDSNWRYEGIAWYTQK